MKKTNGYPYYNKGALCWCCDAPQNGDPDGPEGYPPDFGGYALECPTCHRQGCKDCMPSGRGCKCPECEEGNDD